MANEARTLAENQIKFEDVLASAIHVPGVRIEREQFLRSTFTGKFDEDQIDKAIATRPALAGITVEELNPIAGESIAFESAKVTGLSVAAGIPGGFAMAATIPADLVQYYAHVLRIIQKLSYLYGWPDFFEKNDEEIDDGTKNLLILFLGVMFGAANANKAIGKIAESLAATALKKIPQKALTKGVVYPVVKKVAVILGAQMTKDVFAKGVSKAIPIIGGVVSGGVTVATYTPMCFKFKDYLAKQKLATENKVVDLDIEDIIIDDCEWEDVLAESEDIAEIPSEDSESCHSNNGVMKENQDDVFEQLKKYKELLDMSILTQEEFDTKKKQLLDL